MELFALLLLLLSGALGLLVTAHVALVAALFFEAALAGSARALGPAARAVLRVAREALRVERALVGVGDRVRRESGSGEVVGVGAKVTALRPRLTNFPFPGIGVGLRALGCVLLLACGGQSTGASSCETLCNKTDTSCLVNGSACVDRCNAFLTDYPCEEAGREYLSCLAKREPNTLSCREFDNYTSFSPVDPTTCQVESKAYGRCLCEAQRIVDCVDR